MSWLITMWTKWNVTHANVYKCCHIPDLDTHCGILYIGSNLALCDLFIFSSVNVTYCHLHDHHHDRDHHIHPHHNHAHQDQFVKERGLVMIAPHFLSSHFSLEANTLHYFIECCSKCCRVKCCTKHTFRGSYKGFISSIVEYQTRLESMIPSDLNLLMQRQVHFCISSLEVCKGQGSYQ